ncbi:hypothetical protein G3N98_38230, partial [Burkholderia sp. Tr-20390]|nr:hypothetical protein [Burkholderia sp. Tr-20390]
MKRDMSPGAGPAAEAYRARSRDGKESIALSRRIERPDHTFNGIAVVAIDIAYFE